MVFLGELLRVSQLVPDTFLACRKDLLRAEDWMMSFRQLVDLCIIGGYLALTPYFILLFTTSVAAYLRNRSLRRTQPATSFRTPPRKRFLVAIPAHDEQAGIATTVKSCRALAYPAEQFEVLVVADNCSDSTAERAREAGAKVLERLDPHRKSKGYAIGYLIETLMHSGEFDKLDAIVIVDADSTVHPDLLVRFADGLEAGHEWIQCYDGVSNASGYWRTELMAYAFSLFNGVTLAGQTALGQSASLRGNGMCLSTGGLRRVPWRAHGLAEDQEYSWTARIAGGRIGYADDVAVYAAMPKRGGKSARDQRQRWEHGRREVERLMFGPLLQSPNLRWPRKIASLVELTMPTGTFLFCIYVLLTTLVAFRLPALYIQQRQLLFSVMLVLEVIATLGLLVYAASPFILGLVPWRFVSSLVYIPYYAFWKLSIAFYARPRAWVRTQREPGSGVPRNKAQDSVRCV